MTPHRELSQSYSPGDHANPWRSGLKMARLNYPFTMLLLIVTSAACLAAPASAPDAVRESAVKQARAGDPKGALHILQELLQAYPDDSRLLADTTIVANWAGDDSYTL